MSWKDATYIQLMPYVYELSVLDVGCIGQNRKGELSEFLKNYANEYIGIDTQIDISQNIETVSLNKRFDTIILGDVIEHLNNQEIALKNCIKHLKKDGKIIIITPDCSNLWTFIDIRLVQNKEHTLCHNEGTLKEICKRAGLKVLTSTHVWKYKRKLLMVVSSE